MLFMHTIDKVLSGAKTQTSCLWKDDYFFPSDYYDKTIYTHLLSHKAWDAGKIRKLYYVGQILSVQPARGAKGVAKICITELARRDVRNFTDEDIAKEGFEGINEFLRTWVYMHDKKLFKEIRDWSYHANLTGDITDKRPDELYAALVIRFELIETD